VKYMKKLLWAVASSLSLVGAANAAYINGSVAFSEFGGQNGSFGVSAPNNSSLTLQAGNVVTGSAGDLNNPIISSFTAYATAVTGIKSSPSSTTEAINNYFVFSGGTTPANRFHFEPLTIQYVGTLGEFSGTGTLTDSSGAFDPTFATFNVSFSDAHNYGGTLATVVPEPATYGVWAGALLLLPFGTGLLRALRRHRAA
jgi:hypothetical protein